MHSKLDFRDLRLAAKGYYRLYFIYIHHIGSAGEELMELETLVFGTMDLMLHSGKYI